MTVIVERPILFKGRLVRAILAGAKTQTRRVVKPQPKIADPALYGAPIVERNGIAQESGFGTYFVPVRCPYGVPGDRLWVRETCSTSATGEVLYRADGERDGHTWTPSIHMPRWASRIDLEVTGVRVERLHDITEEDAKAEGAAHRIAPGGDLAGAFAGIAGEISYRAHFADTWREINGASSWDANPWVWVVSFRRVRP